MHSLKIKDFEQVFKFKARFYIEDKFEHKN
jgi:hypothetical protein